MQSNRRLRRFPNMVRIGRRVVFIGGTLIPLLTPAHTSSHTPPRTHHSRPRHNTNTTRHTTPSLQHTSLRHTPSRTRHHARTNYPLLTQAQHVQGRVQAKWLLLLGRCWHGGFQPGSRGTDLSLYIRKLGYALGEREGKWKGYALEKR